MSTEPNQTPCGAAMSDQHESSRAAFEEALHCENVQRLAPHMRLYQHPFTQWRWEGWKLALDYTASRCPSPPTAVPMSRSASPQGEDGKRGGGSDPFRRAFEKKYLPCDYPEDTNQENGKYVNRCQCGTEFVGHKRRVLCKTCAEKPPPQDPVEWVNAKLFEILDSLQSGTRKVLDGDYANALAHRCREAERKAEAFRKIGNCEANDLRTQLAAAQARIAELEDELAKLADPVAVHVNMIWGNIATPSRELMEHVWQVAQRTNTDQ